MKYYLKVLLATLILACFSRTVVFSRNCYRILTPSNSNVEFIIPPQTNLKFRSTHQLLPRYRYFIFEVTGLPSDSGPVDSYDDCIDRICEAKVYFNKYPTCSSKTEEVGYSIERIRFAVIKYKADHSSFLLEINYDSLLKQDQAPEEIINNFQQLAIDLLLHFSKREKDGKWPVSICQNIVEELFGMVPIPQTASLARYGYAANKNRSTIVINPKFVLQVDLAEKTDIPTEDRFSFAWRGSQFVKITRRQAGPESRVLLSSKPMHRITPGLYPTNKLGEKLVLLAASGDIQASGMINTKKYVGWYEGALKRTSSSSNLPAPKSDQIERYNSFLLFSDNIEEFYSHSSTEVPPPLPVKAVYGERSVITPMMYISLNGQNTLIEVNTALADLSELYSIPDNRRIQRMYKGNYTRLENAYENLILLPGDNINY